MNLALRVKPCPKGNVRIFQLSNDEQLSSRRQQEAPKCSAVISKLQSLRSAKFKGSQKEDSGMGWRWEIPCSQKLVKRQMLFKGRGTVLNLFAIL